MKKLLTGVAIGVILMLTTAAVSSTSIQATLFPSKVTIHNGSKITTIDGTGKDGIINYNNKSYIPLRTFSEAMGAKVDYESASKQTNGVHKIDIYQSQANNWSLYKVDEPEGAQLYSVTCPEYPIRMQIWDITKAGSTKKKFNFVVSNFMGEDIRINPIDLTVNIYKSDNNGNREYLIFSKSAPTFSELIPNKYEYLFTFEWDGKGLDGKVAPLGKYSVELIRPEEVKYTVHGSNELKTKAIDAWLLGGCNIPFYGFELY
ncbi:stalk domain-containing protein [Paenibacillus eucommiae]|uniref:Copper amine oxidase-like N-terminal domain-containing protein n=1 Tax=Paenibacillus eucommiae TaxID=1355755 RepID=A0ABS4JBD8_9BACL|nr:stalk domain-containing protein [Paenibacillus eucommiae]MBP1996535.1 hypothetical protein [Paenibacillus eucommiae]